MTMTGNGFFGEPIYSTRRGCVPAALSLCISSHNNLWRQSALRLIGGEVLATFVAIFQNQVIRAQTSPETDRSPGRAAYTW
jgi:hypothetical protein